MSTIIKYLTVFFLLLSQVYGQLYINEVSQGNGGNPPSEYIELVVVGTKTCTDSCADIRGWILDDNMGGFGADGIAGGHVRFSSSPQWECIPYGSIILIYNPLNVFPGIIPDPNDANNDNVYILPISNNLIEANTTIPANGTTTSSYSGATYTSGGASWNSIGLRNGGDGVALYSPSNLSIPTHALTWGSASGTAINFSGSASGYTYVMANLVNSNINSMANWTQSVSTAGTPGYGNSTANTDWITLMQTSSSQITQTINATVCQGQTYSFGGNNISTSGTYTHLFINPSGCDTLKTLNLTIAPKITVTIYDSICQGQAYNFSGNNYSVSGTYRDSIQTLGGCDSITTLHLTVNPINNATIHDTVCEGSGYVFGSYVVASSGTYTNTVLNQYGCDSTTTLHLIVKPSTKDTIKDTICSGQSYSFNGNSYFSSGIYIDSFTNQYGCDSIHTLILTVNSSYHDSIYQTICTGQSVNFNGNVLTASGTYSDSNFTSLGCDSITSLFLTVTAGYHDTIVQSICNGQSVNFAGNTLSTSGVYSDSLLTVSGCDSITTLILSVTSALYDTIHETLCYGDIYIFNNISLNSTGIYQDTLTSAGGCDSVITLNLLVYPAYKDSMFYSICQGEIFDYNNQLYTQAGTYYDTLTSSKGCDSITVLFLTVNQNPVPVIIGDEKGCEGNMNALSVNPLFDNYSWSTGENTQTIHIVTGNNYIVEVTDTNGCLGADSIEVVFEDCDKYCEVFVPNSFTHNYDGLNDSFGPITTDYCAFASFEFLVFNRWGDLLFEAKSANNRWDGTYKGTPVEGGIYIWKLKYRLQSDVNVTTNMGHVNVLR